MMRFKGRGCTHPPRGHARPRPYASTLNELPIQAAAGPAPVSGAAHLTPPSRAAAGTQRPPPTVNQSPSLGPRMCGGRRYPAPPFPASSPGRIAAPHPFHWSCSPVPARPDPARVPSPFFRPAAAAVARPRPLCVHPPTPRSESAHCPAITTRRHPPTPPTPPAPPCTLRCCLLPAGSSGSSSTECYFGATMERARNCSYCG